jgi:hypothetical protein
VTGWWFSLGTQVSSTNKTDRHDKPEILLQVALNTKIHHGHQYLHLHTIFDSSGSERKSFFWEMVFAENTIEYQQHEVLFSPLRGNPYFTSCQRL